jgi:ABC-2 type transport system permease protein
MSKKFRSVAFAVGWRNLHTFFTTPSLILPALLFPLFFFTAFAGGLSAVADVPGFDFADQYITFQYVFVILQSAAFGGVFTGFSIARDFESKFARRLLLAAPKRSALIAGYGFAAAVRWMFTVGIVTVVALAAGIEVSGSAGELFALFLLALLVNIAALLWAAGVAMRFRTIQAGPLMQMPVFLALFLAPVYVPLGLLTGWIHAVASINPVTYILEACRGLISGDPVYIGLAFGLAAALISGFTIWALRSLRKAEAAG